MLTSLATEGYAPRSINLHLIAVPGLFEAAFCAGHVKPPLPFEGLTWQKVDQKARELCAPSEIELFCDVARQASRNGQSFCDYIRFSYSVMSGVDFMTIARWVGHKDGRILIGKVCGRLADEHRQVQAARVTFGAAIVLMPQAAHS